MRSPRRERAARRRQVLLGRVAPVVVGRAYLVDAKPAIDDRAGAREPPRAPSFVIGDGGDQLGCGLDGGRAALEAARCPPVALIERVEVVKAVAGHDVSASSLEPVDPVEDRTDLVLVGRTEGVTE